MKQNHSPTPWKIAETDYEDESDVITGDGKCTISIEGPDDLFVCKSNAALIVRSVNNFIPMKQALENAKEALELMKEVAQKHADAGEEAESLFAISASIQEIDNLFENMEERK